jgi:hypothetical protein
MEGIFSVSATATQVSFIHHHNRNNHNRYNK